LYRQTSSTNKKKSMAPKLTATGLFFDAKESQRRIIVNQMIDNPMTASVVASAANCTGESPLDA
jgi:hypothetical protein